MMGFKRSSTRSMSVTEWLHEVFGEMMEKGMMSDTMRIAIVKLIFKKNCRKRIENYRPISLLCSDYKILAKIATERMKKVLRMVIGTEQQGFVQDGDITGNLILVKEIIEYCNEMDIEGSMIMMDFMKAYDRVDREVMFETLKAMNFGEKMIRIIKVIYEQSEAKVVVNGEMGETFEMKGGVRQGCPLSPYLFIVVLELMAIEVRESRELNGIKMIPEEKGDRPRRSKNSITSHSNYHKQKDSEEDKLSMFADDSSTFIAKTEQIVKTRGIISRYEKATGAKLHDGKTKILKLGRLRRKKLTAKSLGVNFEIMKDEATEEYLGDLVGNTVEEEQRFGPILNKITKLGENWNKENIGVYGRALVANTLMLAKLKHRADVNAISSAMKRRILQEFKDFVWRGKEKRARVRWEVMVKRVEEGGIGIKDPECAMDASKVRMLIRLATRDRQPWMKWVERKLIRVAKKWGVPEAMGAKPKKKQSDGLRQDCLVESTLKIWLEIGGTKKEPRTTRSRKGDQTRQQGKPGWAWRRQKSGFRLNNSRRYKYMTYL